MRTARRSIALLILFCAAGCGPAAPPATPPDPFPPPAAGTGFQVSMTVTAPAGAEIWKCRIGPIPTDGPVAINAVKHMQTPGVHHMDITILLYAGVKEPPGIYDCAELYAKYPKLMEETTLYAAQTATADIQLPTGVAARVPAGLTLMQEIHIVNASAQAIEATSRVNAYSIDSSAVTGTIFGGAVRDVNINVPPGARDTVEWTRCLMNRDADVLFLASHSHQLASDFTIHRFDGKTRGELLYDNKDWRSPPLKAFSPQPLHLAKGEGFEFACHYNNAGTKAIHWGFNASDEMCQIALVYTPGDPDIKCVQVESSDGMLNNP